MLFYSKPGTLQKRMPGTFYVVLRVAFVPELQLIFFIFSDLAGEAPRQLAETLRNFCQLNFSSCRFACQFDHVPGTTVSILS